MVVRSHRVRLGGMDGGRLDGHLYPNALGHAHLDDYTITNPLNSSSPHKDKERDWHIVECLDHGAVARLFVSHIINCREGVKIHAEVMESSCISGMRKGGS